MCAVTEKHCINSWVCNPLDSFCVELEHSQPTKQHPCSFKTISSQCLERLVWTFTNVAMQNAIICYRPLICLLTVFLKGKLKVGTKNKILTQNTFMGDTTFKYRSTASISKHFKELSLQIPAAKTLLAYKSKRYLYPTPETCILHWCFNNWH